MDLGERLRGRHVLITGASGGLGEHFARLSARCGAIVTVAARRRERLELLEQELSAAGAPAVTAAELDVSDESSVECFAAELHKADHPVDILVNNAGIAGTHGALDTPLEEFDRIIATNLRGAWLMSTALARYWREAKRPATIVNIASILGLRVAGGTTPYVVSKGGLVQMTKVLALEWARHGIRVNALAPGYIATDINAGFFESDAGREMIRRIPMRRLGRPEDLDGPFLLLATDASAWMTGSVIAVDGGHHVSSL